MYDLFELLLCSFYFNQKMEANSNFPTCKCCWKKYLFSFNISSLNWRVHFLYIYCIVFFSSKFTVIIRIGFKLTVLNSNFLGKGDAESMVSAVFSVSTLCGKKQIIRWTIWLHVTKFWCIFWKIRGMIHTSHFDSWFMTQAEAWFV